MAFKTGFEKIAKEKKPGLYEETGRDVGGTVGTIVAASRIFDRKSMRALDRDIKAGHGPLKLTGRSLARNFKRVTPVMVATSLGGKFLGKGIDTLNSFKKKRANQQK